MNQHLQKGLIMRSTGSWYEILDGQSKIRKGRLKGKLRLKGYRFTNPIAVGDYVDFELEDEDENTVAIVNIHERKELHRSAIYSQKIPRTHYFLQSGFSDCHCHACFAKDFIGLH